MINEKDFGNRLEMCMQNAQYSNARLTKELEVSKNAVGNYKNGQIPNAAILLKISQLLGTTMEYLLTGQEPTILSIEDKNIIDAYKRADQRTKDIVNLSLQPYMEHEKSSRSEAG